MVAKPSAASSLSRFFIAIRGKEHFLEVLKEDYQVSLADSYKTTFPSKKGITHLNTE